MQSVIHSPYCLTGMSHSAEGLPGAVISLRADYRLPQLYCAVALSRVAARRPTAGRSGLPEPSSGSLSTTMTSAGTTRSDAPLARAWAWKALRAAPFCSVTSKRRSPRRGSGCVTTAEAASGHSSTARVSTAASEIISPPILAKRLARPLIVTKPSQSIATMSPVSCQPSSLLDPGHRFEPCFDPRQQASDGAEAVEHRRVESESGCGFSDAVAFKNAQTEFFRPYPPSCLLDRLGARQHVADGAKIVGVRGAGIARQKGVGAEHDRCIGAVNELGDDAV